MTSPSRTFGFGTSSSHPHGNLPSLADITETIQVLPPADARRKLFRHNILLIRSSDRRFAFDDSNFPPFTQHETWTIARWRRELGDQAKNLHMVIVENRTLDITVEGRPPGTESLEDQPIVATGWFDSHGTVVFKLKAPKQRIFFCTCSLTSDALDDGTNASAPINMKKEGRRLLNIMEAEMEERAFCYFEPECRICSHCGLPEVLDVTLTRECRDLYPDLE